MNYSIISKTIIAGLFACLASGSVQAITWKEYVKQNGVPQIVDGRLNLANKRLEDIDFADIENKELITGLCLHSNNLQVLPVEIVQFKNLQWLDIHCNKLQSLPKEIGKLENLRTLSLAANRELQKMPVEIGKLEKLRELYLAGCNKLQILPVEIGQLKELKVLSLVAIRLDNQLRTLPPTFSKLAATIHGLSPEQIKQLQENFMSNLNGFILQAIRENNEINVRKFTRSILERCELSPCDFKDEQGNNLLHLAIKSNMYCEGENEAWKVRDPEWKILKELIACNVNNSVAKMLQEEDEQGNTPLWLLLGKDVGVFKQVFKAGRLKTPPSLLQICTQFLQDNDVDVKQALGSAVLLPEACGGHRDEKNEGRDGKEEADNQASENDGKMEEL